MNLDPASSRPLDLEATSESLRVAQYRLLRRIGSGGFGTVFEAWDERLDRAVAVKILHQQNAAANSALLHEARAAASLEHPAFARVIEIIDQGVQSALVLELIRGQPLSERLRQGPVAPLQALDWLRQIAVAMQSAHAASKVHGDLKPGNVMVDNTGQIRILDFGLSRELNDSHSTTSSAEHQGAGTLAYLAPEQLHGAPCSPETDLYAIGLLLGVLLSGDPPFAEFRGAALAQAICHGDDPPHALKATCPEPVRRLYLSLTARDPTKRGPQLGELIECMDALRKHEANADAAPASLASRGRLRIWLAGFAVVLMFIWAGMQWQSGPRSVLSDFQRLQAAERDLDDLDRPGALDQAIDTLEALLEDRPDHAAAAAALAIAYCFQYTGSGRDESWLHRAAAAADLALKHDPQLARAHVGKGWVLEFQGQYAEAREQLEQALLLDPTDRYALLAESRVLAKLGDDAASKATLERAIQRHPAERLFADALGTWYFRHAQYAEAENQFRHAIALKPDSIASYGNLNAVLLHQNRLDEALSVLQQGLRNRQDGRLYTNLGTVLFMLGRYPESAEAFERAVGPEFGSPNDYLRWANLADALRFVPGRESDSEQAYRTALNLLEPMLARAPGDVPSRTRAALFRAKLAQCPESLADIHAIREQAAQNADALFRIAYANELCHRRDQALTDLGAALTQGYPLHLVLNEPDLRALRRDLRFQERVLGNSSLPFNH